MAEMRIARRLRIALIAVTCFALLGFNAPAALAEDELATGRFALVAPDGRILLRTGVVVTEGDWLLTPDGAVYRVARVDGQRAELVSSRAEAITYRSPLSPLVWPSTVVWPIETSLVGNRVVIYSTHGDETLRGAVAVSGTGGEDAIPVLASADSFAAEASTWKLDVTVDTTSHWPHDGNAYRRSALTVRDLMRSRPDVFLDWQTDRAPAAGEPAEAPAVLLVVGGSTPRLRANLKFARALMTAADRPSPGSVKGILVCRGDYAQLYYPASVVVLAGTSADDAKSVSALGTVLADALGDLHSAAQRDTSSMATHCIIVLGLAMLFQRLARRQWRGRWRWR